MWDSIWTNNLGLSAPSNTGLDLEVLALVKQTVWTIFSRRRTYMQGQPGKIKNIYVELQYPTGRGRKLDEKHLTRSETEKVVFNRCVAEHVNQELGLNAPPNVCWAAIVCCAQAHSGPKTRKKGSWFCALQDFKRRKIRLSTPSRPRGLHD